MENCLESDKENLSKTAKKPVKKAPAKTAKTIQKAPAIGRIEARPGQQAYGMGLGVILLDDVYPGFPGDVRNASGYPFPIQYEVVSGVDIKKLVVEPNKIMCLPPLIRAAEVGIPSICLGGPTVGLESPFTGAAALALHLASALAALTVVQLHIPGAGSVEGG